MPAGEICGSIDEVVASLEPLLARDGRAVLKPELGTAGSGVIIVDANSTDTSGTELRPYIEARMAQRPALFYSGPYVVEAFVGPSGGTEDLSHGATFVTVFIHSDGMFETLGAARERRNTHNRIAAVEVGRDSGPANTPEMFDESVRTLCAAAAAIGYRGSAIFDFLLDSHADPAVIEMNARRGTAGFVFTLAQALFGPDWTNRHSGLIRLPLHVEPSERLNPDRVLDVIETTNQSLSGDAVIVPVSLTWLKLPNPGVAIVTFGSDRTAISEAESGLSEWLAQVS